MSVYESELQREAERLTKSIVDANPSLRDEMMYRLQRYPILKGGQHICPKCWMSFETDRPLRRVKGQPGLTCFGCNSVFAVIH